MVICSVICLPLLISKRMAMGGKVVCLAVLILMVSMEKGEGSWCVAKIDASEEALQSGLDSACGDGGADCTPIQPDGLCYIPNTLQAHASYAFNSFYQRNARAPYSCHFAGTSTIAQTDPSYGSCVYPSSASSAGVTNTSETTPTMNNYPNVPTTPIHGGDGGLTTPQLPENSSKAITSTTTFLVFLSFLLILFEREGFVRC